jgi:hypothetical protein
MAGDSSERLPRERLSVVPTEVASAIRSATVDQDVDRLFALVDGVADHDAEVAAYLRGLVEDVAYDTLEDLFGS